jgi:hypothetical protein
MTEPTTEAGRALLDNPGGTRQVRAFAILAIEAQAVAAWLASPDAEQRLTAALPADLMDDREAEARAILAALRGEQ